MFDASAVLVTRGNVNLGPIVASLQEFPEIIIWNNQDRPDSRVYGRYLACLETTYPLIFVQDDDCIVQDIPAILAAWEPGKVVANMPPNRRTEYNDGIALIGYGGCFAKDAVGPALTPYLGRWPMDELFLRECDRVFTAFSSLRLVDVPYRNFSYAESQDRMWKEPTHVNHLGEIRRRIQIVKDELRASPN